MKDVGQLRKYCVLCGKEWGPNMAGCCTPSSLVRMRGSALRRSKTRYYDLQGRDLSQQDLSEIREREEAVWKKREQDLRKPTARQPIPWDGAEGVSPEALQYAEEMALRRMDELMRHLPPRSNLWAHPYWLIRFNFAMVGAAFAVRGAWFFFDPGPSGGAVAHPLAFLGLGLLLMAMCIRWLIRVGKSPLRRVPAIALSRRRGFTIGTAIRFLTIRTDEEGEKEYVAAARVLRGIGERDAGVAYFKSRLLVDFKVY